MGAANNSSFAVVTQLVERHPSKVEVASSSLVYRSYFNIQFINYEREIYFN